MIKIKILSWGGLETIECPGKKALEIIKEAASNGRWIYFDCEFIVTEGLTIATIRKAGDITITNSLYGG